MPNAIRIAIMTAALSAVTLTATATPAAAAGAGHVSLAYCSGEDATARLFTPLGGGDTICFTAIYDLAGTGSWFLEWRYMECTPFSCNDLEHEDEVTAFATVGGRVSHDIPVTSNGVCVYLVNDGIVASAACA